jgi:hypothetical protein
VTARPVMLSVGTAVLVAVGAAVHVQAQGTTVGATCGYNAERQQLELNILNRTTVSVVAWVASAQVIDGPSATRIGTGQDGALGVINPQRWTAPIPAGEGTSANLRAAGPSTGCTDARVDFVVYADGTYEGEPRLLQELLGSRRRQAQGAHRLLAQLTKISVADLRASRGSMFGDDPASRVFKQQLSAIWVRPLDDDSASAVLTKTIADVRDWAALGDHLEAPRLRR